MKKSILFLLACLLLNVRSLASPGDTITVQTFTFGAPQDAWFVFPSDTVRFEKILMQYTLKCNPAQSPPCGEWDYLTYTYLYKNTGLLDSTLVHQPVYTMNGAAPATYGYMTTPSYSYHPVWQYTTVHTDTTSLNMYAIGSGSTANTSPFGAINPVSRCQYLWKAGEMSSAGMSAGNITGLRFFLQSLGSRLDNLTIRIAASTLDSLSPATLVNTGFTTVYAQNTQFSTTGWNSLQLTTPYNWNGTSNLVIDITYSNDAAATNNTVASTATSSYSGLSNAGSDRCASFHSTGYVNVPLNNKLVAIDSFVTVAFWCYGSPSLQPMDGTAFEAVDSAGNRLLNSHCPWSDGKVYFDAGFSATSYDRVSKAATATEMKGQWNYWVMTKNVATGYMKIYLNGALWLSNNGKVKRMKGIKYFRIGQGNWSGSLTYEGKIDEFAVFNAELSLATIQQYMYKPIDAAHPNYANLAAYYHFDDGNYLRAADAAPGAHAPATFYSTDNPLKYGSDLVTGFSKTTLRPNITFEQGVFTSHPDSVMIVDSTINAPVQVVYYNDSVNHPGVAMDTATVWPAYYHNYVYDAAGHATDSALVTPDSTLHEVYYDFYHRFPKIDRYELARYITPYGNSLSLGSGWTWTFDVSDYRTLLADSVHLSAGNWQELLDMKFLMIKGTPPRDVLGIRNLWNGGFNYGQPGDPIESHLPPLSVNIPANAVNTRWKSRITGHGMDLPDNCAEFCAKHHYFKVDGTQQFNQLVWRDNCDLNPLYPQGGTWVYDRANWCPGAEVWTYDFELTPYVTPGNTAVLDHDVEPYTNTGDWDYFQIEDQLVSYSAPNFTLDAAIEDILSPSTNQMWTRYNPICTSPVIRIKNTGSTTLTSLTITYGLNGGTPSTYTWTGSLPFMQTAEVTLGNFAWVPSATDFTVTVSNPNGGTDQYANNNTKTSHYVYPPIMPSQLIIEFKTNNYNSEDQYTLKDAGGTIIRSRNGALLSPNTVYKDTVTLADGCYEFELTDSGEDGLSFWANPDQGVGYLHFRRVSPYTILKNFNADFGGQVYQQFTVNSTTGIDEFVFAKENTLNVYPNPSNGHIYINVDLASKESGTVEITDLYGKKVYEHAFKESTAESLEADLSGLRKGMYFVYLRTKDDVSCKKLIMQ